MNMYEIFQSHSNNFLWIGNEVIAYGYQGLFDVDEQLTEATGTNSQTGVMLEPEGTVDKDAVDLFDLLDVPQTSTSASPTKKRKKNWRGDPETLLIILHPELSNSNRLRSPFFLNLQCDTLSLCYVQPIWFFSLSWEKFVDLRYVVGFHLTYSIIDTQLSFFSQKI